MKVTLRLLSLATLIVSAFAADRSFTVNGEIASAISARMKQYVADGTVAGAVTLVSHGNDIVEFDAVGMADIEAKRPIAKDTIFQIMSMTKPVTAIGIMMLAEGGKLSLRDPVEQYLPEFQRSAGGFHRRARCGTSR